MLELASQAGQAVQDRYGRHRYDDHDPEDNIVRDNLCAGWDILLPE